MPLGDTGRAQARIEVTLYARRRRRQSLRSIRRHPLAGRQIAAAGSREGNSDRSARPAAALKPRKPITQIATRLYAARHRSVCALSGRQLVAAFGGNAVTGILKESWVAGV